MSDGEPKTFHDLPSGYLRRDHQGIMRKLTEVEDALQRLASEGTLAQETLRTLARSLDDEVERHFKIEELALGAALGHVEPEERAVLSEILQQHERLRQEMGRFQAAVQLQEDGYLSPASNAQSKLILRGLDLVRSLVQHMQREENSSFLDADLLLTPEEQQQVAQQLKEAAIWQDLLKAPISWAPALNDLASQ